MTLMELQEILGRKRNTGALAKWIAAQAGCSIPTVYRRIRALQAKGAVIAEVKGSSQKTGPVPGRFILIKEAKL